MNPFVNPQKRTISLPSGCNDLADVLARPQLAARSPIRRFINLVLMQAEHDCATELVIGVARQHGEGIPVKYSANGFSYEMSPWPSGIRARIIKELRKMAGLQETGFPLDGVISLRLSRVTLVWRVRIDSPNADCVLTKTDV